MNAGDFFVAAAALPVGTLADIVGAGGLVILAPHPDDESLGCGGLIASACAAGRPVRLIVLSDGVGSHPNSRRYPAAKLRTLREQETRAAAAALGLSGDDIAFLGLPDRSVPTQGPEAVAARAAILEAIRACVAGAVCVTWGRDPHCDHAAAASLAREAARDAPGVRLYSYPVWGWTLPVAIDVGSAPRGWRFAIAPYRAAKQAAIAAHRSQTSDLIDDDPDGFRLTADMLAHFAGPYEILLSEP